MGGKEAASARYIFTSLSPVTRHIFNEMDDAVLNFLEEEGMSIEPKYYLPILPMCLVNGAEGIGTGWSTSIPQFCPRELVENLKSMMKGSNPRKLKPWYKGFQGDISESKEKSYVNTGIYEIKDDTTIEITELPIGKWTRDYKTFLEELAAKDEIDDIREYHMENRVHFILTVPKLRELEQSNQILKYFKLQGSIPTTQFVLFNEEGKICRYEDELHVLREFFPLRGRLYSLRKEYMLAKLSKDYEILFNKVKFIQAIISETLKINKVKRNVIIERVIALGLKPMSEL
jgi:DNA topoisomerase II